MTSTYKDLKTSYSSTRTYSYDGYAIEMPVMENVKIGFFPWGGQPKDDQFPSWIDLLPELPEDRCPYAATSDCPSLLVTL